MRNGGNRVRRALLTKSRGGADGERRALMSELATERRRLLALEASLRDACERARAGRSRDTKRLCGEHARLAGLLAETERLLTWLGR